METATELDNAAEPDAESSGEGGKALIVMHDGTQYVLRERYTTVTKRLDTAESGTMARLVLSSGKRVSVNPSLVAAVEEQ